MKHYIIDVFNLLHKEKSIAMEVNKSLSKAIKLTYDLLYIFALRYPKYKISLVFDGIIDNIHSDLQNLYIYESGNYKKADEVIMELIRFEHKTKNVTVVSSDIEVAQYAKIHDCNIISSDNFILELQLVKAGKLKPSEVKEYNKVKLMTNKTEIENYLEIFESSPLDKDLNPIKTVKSKKYTFEQKNESKSITDDTLNLSELKNYFETGSYSTEVSKRIKKENKLNNSIPLAKKEELSKDDDELLREWLK
jgi:hypothetical protein